MCVLTPAPLPNCLTNAIVSNKEKHTLREGESAQSNWIKRKTKTFMSKSVCSNCMHCKNIVWSIYNQHHKNEQKKRNLMIGKEIDVKMQKFKFFMNQTTHQEELLLIFIIKIKYHFGFRNCSKYSAHAFRWHSTVYCSVLHCRQFRGILALCFIFGVIFSTQNMILSITLSEWNVAFQNYVWITRA